jgi:hypothetical protein
VNWKLVAALAVAFAVLAYGTVFVFLAFDRDSHSASDTLRPFLITMVPVWVVTLVGARALIRRQGQRIRR